MPAGMPTRAPTSAPTGQEPTAQPRRAPIPTPPTVVPTSTAPAPAGSSDWRELPSIHREHTRLCDTKNRMVWRKLPQLVASFSSGAKPRRLGAAALVAAASRAFLTAADARVRELDDLEQVGDVERREQRGQTDKAGHDRVRDVPVTARPRRQEARRQRGGGPQAGPAG